MKSLEDISSKRDVLIQGGRIPPTYKIGRAFSMQTGEISRDLFSVLEENKQGSYVISGLSRSVTEVDFEAFCIAIGQTLSNQSYLAGNIIEFSGLSKKLSKKHRENFGGIAYNGDVRVTLNELCRNAYGVNEPSTEQRNSMSTLLEALHHNKLTITAPNGEKLESTLCATMSKYTAEDGAITYDLYLHPILCHKVATNFAELPQDYTKRLTKAVTRKTAAHYKLSLLLASQDKRKPFVRTMAQLLKDLNLEAQYKKDRGRTEKQILSVVESMKQTELISDYATEYITVRNKKLLYKFTFKINPIREERSEEVKTSRARKKAPKQ